MHPPIRIALFQPDIPQNTGAILRTAACLGLAVDLVEPAGFRLDDRSLRRARLDTGARAALVRHRSWPLFLEAVRGDGRRLVLLTATGEVRLDRAAFEAGDTLLFGRETAGVPDAVRAAADLAVAIPIAPGTRSLNVSVAAGIAAAEALRQLGAFPGGEPRTAGDGCPPQPRL